MQQYDADYVGQYRAKYALFQEPLDAAGNELVALQRLKLKEVALDIVEVRLPMHASVLRGSLDWRDNKLALP